jgi:pseudaminic acid synthase
MKDLFSIDGRVIGEGRVFVIAELSANHGKDLDIALQTVEAAAWAGADAIKLQTVNPGLITLDCDKPCFQVPSDTPWAGQTLYQLEVDTFLPREWHAPIFAKARSLGLSCFSSPFDLTAIDFLEELDSPAYKIASFEITDVALIEKAAQTGKPVIISTGIATEADIELAVKTCHSVGNRQIALLKCTSAYPTPLDQVDLRSMPALGRAHGCPFGLSDHTLGDSVAVGAAALGASVIEKHFVLNDRIQSADADFSMQPAAFKDMVKRVRDLEAALGSEHWRVTPAMVSGRQLARSLFVVEDVKAGELFTADNVRSIRPGIGMPPKMLPTVLGKLAATDISRGTPLLPDLIQG